MPQYRNANGSVTTTWLSGTIDLSPLQTGDFFIGTEEQSSGPLYGYGFYALQYHHDDGLWYVRDRTTTRAQTSPAQPGSQANFALYIDSCNDVSYLYLSTSANVYQEVDRVVGGSSAYRDKWVFGSSGPVNLVAQAHNLQVATGIPADVAVTNWQETGTTVVGSQYAAGPGNGDALGPRNPSENCNKCQQGMRPINTATGDFWHTFGDLGIPGRGLPLAFAHTYDSLLASQDGPLGFGWTDTYNLFLSTDASGAVTVHQEAGNTVTFATTGAGYQPHRWVLATLVHNGDGTFTFTRTDRTQYVFSAPSQTAAGQLLREVDRNGYTTTLGYTNGLLSSVTDPAGRSLSIGYNASNRVSSIADSANRSVSFGYDASGNLTDYTDSNGGHWHFTYGSTHLLLTMEDPNQYALHGALSSGPVTTNVYDGSGRVTQQSDPMNRPTTFSYVANSDGSQTVTITDPNGTVTTQLYVNNEPTRITAGVGTPQAANWQFSYDTLGGTLGLAS
jgi:YD repeat-containing protein